MVSRCEEDLLPDCIYMAWRAATSSWPCERAVGSQAALSPSTVPRVSVCGRPPVALACAPRLEVSGSDRVRPMRRFTVLRLGALQITALVLFVACSQGPGTLEPREPDDPLGATEPPDTAPAFAGTVADQTYQVGKAISPLRLPAASGGNGTLSYSLRPTVPGLSFAAATRTLSGTPTSTGSYAMTYQVVDGGANTAASDAASLTFTITVEAVPTPVPVGCSADAETWRGLRVCD